MKDLRNYFLPDNLKIRHQNKDIEKVNEIEVEDLIIEAFLIANKESKKSARIRNLIHQKYIWLLEEGKITRDFIKKTIENYEKSL